MHELSLMKDMINKISTIAAEKNARSVVKVSVSIGALAHISEDHFREHFEEETVGTVAEGAKLLVEMSDDITASHALDVMLLGLELSQ